MYFCPCYWSFIAETKVTKRAEIQIRILALNFYMWKRFTGQQYIIIWFLLISKINRYKSNKNYHNNGKKRAHIFMRAWENFFFSYQTREPFFWIKYKQSSFSTFPIPVLMLFICCPNTAHIMCGGLTHIVRRLNTIGAEY